MEDKVELEGEEMNMNMLVEVKNEVETYMKANEIDEDYCINIIKHGNAMVGYGLWLAKENIYKDSKTGWESFCKKAGVVRVSADRLVAFYLAKSEPIGSELPNNEGAFRELEGDTPEEKAEMYQRVKELTGKEKPTGLDIRVTKAIESRGIKDKELVIEAQEVMNNASPAVRDAFASKAKQVGLQKIVDAVKEGKNDEEIITVIKGKAKEDAKSLLEEKKALDEAYKELDELYENTLDMVMKFNTILRLMKNENMATSRAFASARPQMKKAISMLELQGSDITNWDYIKKKYRQLAKERHPDKEGGDEEKFKELNEAYSLLKKELGV
jgi:hypothetical protein